MKELDSIIVFENRLVFKNVRDARIFAYKYLKANEKLYCNALQATLYYKIAETLKLVLEKNIITENDLLSDDFVLYRKLYNNDELRRCIKLIDRVRVIENNEDFEIYVKSKVRYADPLILMDDELQDFQG